MLCSAYKIFISNPEASTLTTLYSLGITKVAFNLLKSLNSLRYSQKMLVNHAYCSAILSEHTISRCLHCLNF